MAHQFLSLDLSLPEQKPGRATSPGRPGGQDAGEGLLEDFLAQWRPDVLNRKLDHARFFNHVVELARRVTGSDGSAIAFRGEQGTICRARIGQGAPPLGAAVDTSSGISKDCLEWGMSIRCEDIDIDGRVDPEACRALGIRSLAVVPIFCDRKIAGILEVFSGAPANFNDQHLQRLQKLAKWVGAAASSLDNCGSPNPSISPVAPFAAKVTARQSGMVPTGAEHSPSIAQLKPSDVKGWGNVLLRESPLPWHRLFASALLHAAMLALFWGVTEFAPNEIDLNSQSQRAERITYYPISQSAPPLEARNESRESSKPRKVSHSQHRVTAPALVATKNTGKETKSQPPALSHAPQTGVNEPEDPTQPMPEIASSGSRRPAIGLSAAVQPAPDAGPSSGRSSQLPSMAVVPPVPDIKGGPSRRSAGLSAASAVPPAPSNLKGGSRISQSLDISIIPPAPRLQASAGISVGRGITSNSLRTGGLVVGPAPSLEGQSGRSASGRAMLSAGHDGQPVPPAASIDGIRAAVGRGRGSTLAAGGTDVIAPSPSVELGAGGERGSGRIAGLSSSSIAIIPPSPAVVNGVGGQGGRHLEGPAVGSGVIPPSPSLASGSGTSRGRLATSLTGNGSSVIPAPPSVQSVSGRNSGRSGKNTGFGGNGLDVVPPQPSLSSQGGAGGRNSQAGFGAGDARPPAGEKSAGASGAPGTEAGTPQLASSAGTTGPQTTEPQSSGAQPSAPPSGEKVMPVFQDAQVKVISLAWAPPKSSYFSNFEVFIAEKWLGKNQTEVIKLVYVFLPYQRRLSEYGAENPKVRKLRVTRDPSCDESLMQISWPEGGDPNSHVKESMTAEDRKNLLPCYRTTADDYRQAVSRNP